VGVPGSSGVPNLKFAIVGERQIRDTIETLEDVQERFEQHKVVLIVFAADMPSYSPSARNSQVID
jgi:hypothetical protein